MVTAWPKELEWIIDALEETTFQRRREFRTASGHVKSRPAHSPMPALQGMVTLNESDWTKLNDLRQTDSAFSVTKTPNGRGGTVVFSAAPFEKKISMSNQGPTIRDVEIKLVFTQKL
jgi:hypothetical protein